MAVDNFELLKTNVIKAVDADYVICTVPLGVLQHQVIKFKPKLPKTFVNEYDAKEIVIDKNNFREFIKI